MQFRSGQTSAKRLMNLPIQRKILNAMLSVWMDSSFWR